MDREYSSYAYGSPMANVSGANRGAMTRRFPDPLVVDTSNDDRFHPTQHQLGSQYLTSYATPLTPDLSRTFSKVQLSPGNDLRFASTTQSALAAANAYFGAPASPLCGSPPSLEYSSQLPPAGTESHHDRDKLRVQIPIIHSPCGPSSTSSEFLSPVPPTPDTPFRLNITPLLYTCPTLSKNKPLPDHYGLSPSIDPKFLHASGETDRGRQLRPVPIPGRRSLSQGVASRAPSTASSGRAPHVPRPQSLLPPEPELELPLSGFPAVGESDDEPSSLFDPVPISVAPEEIFGLADFAFDDFSSILENSDEEASISHDHDNNQANGNAPQSTAFRPVVASEEVMIASRNRRTTKGPRHRCPVRGCNADFTAKHNLKNHLNAHNGIKKYECEFCERRYTTSHVLNRHKRTCKRARQDKSNQ